MKVQVIARDAVLSGSGINHYGTFEGVVLLRLLGRHQAFVGVVP